MKLEKQLITILNQNLGLDQTELSREIHFYQDLNISKLEVADLIMACQQETGIKVEETAVNQVATVGDLINLFEEKSNEL